MVLLFRVYNFVSTDKLIDKWILFKIIYKIKEIFKDLSYNDEPLLFNARQLGLLNQAKAHLLEAKRQAENGQVIDLISIDLKQAYICILEIN